MSVDADLELLRTELGFRIVREEESQPGERSAIVLESNDLRIEIEHERGVRVIYFSAIETPNERYVDNALLNFIEHRHGLPRESDPATRLRKHMLEIVAALASARTADWWKAYDAYRADRLRQMREKK